MKIDACKGKLGASDIFTTVEPSEPSLMTGEAILQPYPSSLRKNHIRVEDEYVIGSRVKQVVIEGRAEDVIKILKCLKVGEIND